MIIFKSIKILNKKVNFTNNVGFVPTMGALHKGHVSLIKKSKLICNKTIVSIFINRAQFNKIGDYKKYPRYLSKDIKILKQLNVDYLLLPEEKDIFKSKKQMKIKINNNDKVMCAKYRPGHFEGVLAVINQFLSFMKPRYIFLGEKDYQQIYLIKKYLSKKYNTKIFKCKTIRLNKALPYSSRNLLLKKNELLLANEISLMIKKIFSTYRNSYSNIKQLNKIKSEILKKKIKLEYLELRNKFDLSKKINKKNVKIFISYYVNKVRLIDNY
tara:strand:+ start:402 stop:1211 length:810 start_codon:yes stop_codon:yes gene_type:complete